MKKKQTEIPKPSVLLKEALTLLGPKGNKWVKNAFEIEPGIKAYDSTTKKERVFRHGAFCASGALSHVNTPNEYEASCYLVKAIKAETGYVGIIAANDNSSTEFKDIKRWFTAAIKLARKDKR